MSVYAKLWLLLIAVILSVLPLAQPLSSFNPEAILPDQTLVVASITNGNQFCQELRTTKLWNLWQDKEWQEFFAALPLGDALQEWEKNKAKAEKELGISLESLHQTLAGQMMVAVPQLELGKDPVVVISWDLGQAKDQFSKFFDQIRKKGRRGNKPEKTENKYGLTIVTVEGPKPVQFTYVGNTLVVCNDSQYFSNILNPQFVQAQPLAQSLQYNTVKQQLLQGHHGAYLYINTQAILKLLEGPAGDNPQIQQALMLGQMIGIHKFAALALGLSFRNGQVTESFYLYTPEGREGLVAKLVPSKTTPQTLISSLPENPILFEHGPLYINELYQTWKELFSSFNPEEYQYAEKEIAKVEELLGFRLDEVFAAIGDEYLLVVSCNGGLVPDISFQITLKDPAKMQFALQKLCALAPAKFQRTVNWQGHTLTYFNFSTKREPIPIAPAFVIEGNRLIIALFPETVKTVLKTTNGKLPADIDLSLQNRPYTELGYLNFKTIIVPLYRTALPLFQAVAPSEEIPFDPALLPSADFVQNYLSNLVSIAQCTEQGILYEIHSPTGVTPWIGAAGVIGHHVSKQKRFGPKNNRPPFKNTPPPPPKDDDEF